MEKSESIVKLAIALAKFNGEVSSISKDAKNPFFKSDYVTLDKLILATREILQKNGLSILQIPLSKDSGEIGIQTILIHESGEYIESQPLFMKPVKNDPQAAGSLITYLRRYSYQAILNLNTGEDDDANLPTHGDKDKVDKPKKPTPPQNSNTRVISEAQCRRLHTIAKGKEAHVKAIIAKYGYSSSKDIKMSDYNNICAEVQKNV